MVSTPDGQLISLGALPPVCSNSAPRPEQDEQPILLGALPLATLTLAALLSCQGVRYRGCLRRLSAGC